MKKMAVAYLDLLGFRDYVSIDIQGSARLLMDYSETLNEAFSGEFDVPPNRLSMIPDAADARIREHNALTSFRDFLPMSDGVFITAEDPSLLVFQMSNFLINSFVLRGHVFDMPMDRGDPTRVSITTVVGTQDGIEEVEEEEHWFPVLFRGGVTWGEVVPLKMRSMISGEKDLVTNLIGSGVVEAVRIEQKRTHGPRILCSLSLVGELDEGSQRFVGPVFDDPEATESEIYWPMALFEGHENVHVGLCNAFGSFLRSAINLWKSQMFRAPEKHYRAFTRLLIQSALRQYPKQESYVRGFAKRVANELGLAEGLLFGTPRDDDWDWES